MLARSPTQIPCQTCANGWPLTQTEGQYYFRGAGPGGQTAEGHDIGDYTSPSAIAGLDPDATMTFCPRCDVELLEPTPIPGAPEGVKGLDPFYHGDDRMTGSQTDAGSPPDATPGDADSAVTHRTDDLV